MLNYIIGSSDMICRDDYINIITTLWSCSYISSINYMHLTWIFFWLFFHHINIQVPTKESHFFHEIHVYWKCIGIYAHRFEISRKSRFWDSYVWLFLNASLNYILPVLCKCVWIGLQTHSLVEWEQPHGEVEGMLHEVSVIDKLPISFFYNEVPSLA